MTIILEITAGFWWIVLWALLNGVSVCARTGSPVRGAGERPSPESVCKVLSPKWSGATGGDPEWYQQVRGSAFERALHQRAPSDRPAPAQTAPVSPPPLHTVRHFGSFYSFHCILPYRGIGLWNSGIWGKKMILGGALEMGLFSEVKTLSKWMFHLPSVLQCSQ